MLKIDADDVMPTFTQERFEKLVEEARAARDARKAAQARHREATEELDNAREHETVVKHALHDLVMSHAGYAKYE